MAAAVAHPVGAMREEAVMDTRTPSPVLQNGSADIEKTTAAETYMPDLAAEVAMLSTKLVNAINYQTTLDDSLQQTRHERDRARAEVARVRAEKKSLDDMIANGLLIRKSFVEQTINQMREELAVAKTEREAAEVAKKETEGELENLTSALFEEANTMVATARKDAETVEKRNSQLKNHLSDTEVLLASQQEQLQDLKQTMERMERVNHDSEAMSVPTTPIDRTSAAFEAMQLPLNGEAHNIPPEHPLHFTHLIAPVLRNDTSAYADFQDLLLLARRASPHSRSSSNNTNSLASISTPNLQSTSSPHLPGSFSFNPSSQSANNSPSSTNFNPQPMPTLRETRFYKRVAVEDIDPCLRLDLAPGLSFLSRRTVLSSLLSGSLVVEPFMQPSNRLYTSSIYACTLCGESRKTDPYVRRYRFRTSEDEGAQRYPLCDYCLNRVRAAGDFVGFLRMVRDGHWKAESEVEQRSAWEESVRLRERMFWARLGGGVVPAYLAAVRSKEEMTPRSPSGTAAIKSARLSLEGHSESMRKDAVVAAASAVTQSNGAGRPSRGDTLHEVGATPDGDISAPSAASGGIGRAIIGVSSGVLSTARPDVSPHRPHGVQAELEPVPSQDDEPATPSFEDAPAVQSFSQEEQAAADEQLQREAASTLVPPDSAAYARAPAIHEPALMPPPEPKKRNSSPASSRMEINANGSGTATALPLAPPNERRPSAVQARIRAMEAKAQEVSGGGQGLPGAFE